MRKAGKVHSRKEEGGGRGARRGGAGSLLQRRGSGGPWGRRLRGKRWHPPARRSGSPSMVPCPGPPGSVLPLSSCPRLECWAWHSQPCIPTMIASGFRFYAAWVWFMVQGHQAAAFTADGCCRGGRVSPPAVIAPGPFFEWQPPGMSTF